MFNCQNLLHPFQNDPGTSQRQRIVDQLLSSYVKIDGRSLADLLNYFSDLSTAINYYDKNLVVSDWQPFFRQNLPFLLASISRFDYKAQQDKFDFYKLLFTKAVSSSGLQLIIHFIYYATIYKIDSWYQDIEVHDLPIRATLEDLVRNKLSKQLRTFIPLVNASAKWFGTKRIDFSPLLHRGENNVWGIDLKDIHSVDDAFMGEAAGRCAQMKLLYEKLTGYFPSFLEGMKLLATAAENDIQASLIPAGNELKKDHPPHLALIFAFIRLFQKMQEELNKKTKEHLKYFYTEVLQLKPRDAEPDKANIIFEVQKILQDQYQKYLLKKGTTLNGGRDNKNTDIVFETDDEIIVNETQVAEVRTLFLNNELSVDEVFVEGVYIAPVADKADGVDKDFKDDDPKNWFTLGRNVSKYREPGKLLPKPYPFARLGFVLASPVLYMTEGKRTIDITIDCRYEDSICKTEEDLCKANNGTDCPEYPEFNSAGSLFPHVKDFLSDAAGIPIAYIVISADVLANALAAGMSSDSASAIRNRFLSSSLYNPCTSEPQFKDFIIVEYSEWLVYINTPANLSIYQEVSKLPGLFQKRYPFKISFSGEKEWIEPSSITKLQLVPGGGRQFNFIISAELGIDKASVSFYNKENLGEDLGTEMPAVKIELDDLLKLSFFPTNLEPDCCLEKIASNEEQHVSLYHFFRNVIVQANTKIEVTVCGLKNFIVQNDENVMDVNGIVFPFATRPKIGSNFIIGCKELFYKNWSAFNVKFNWKDKPADFSMYYHGYEDLLATPTINTAYFNNDNFKFEYSLLESGSWFPRPTAVPPPPRLKRLFTSEIPGFCTELTANQTYSFLRGDFNLSSYRRRSASDFKDIIFSNSSQDGFLRFSLVDRDFQHSRYSFVLTRQMLAMGRFPLVYVGPVYDGVTVVGNMVIPVITFDDLFKAIKDSFDISQALKPRTDGILTSIRNAFNGPFAWDIPNETLAKKQQSMGIPPPDGQPMPQQVADYNKVSVDKLVKHLDEAILGPTNTAIQNIKEIRVVIPNEPYTPQLQNISIDYKASSDVTDIDLIHLYPFKGTYKPQQIDLNPTLFPTFCDEGTLFIGLKDLQPANNLNILFQFAEATADSETEAEIVHWHYLDNNSWKPLRKGFEVLNDGTLNLTTSGIVKFSLPENMTNDNTIMPPGVHWIKASMAKNSRSASETLNIYTQAIEATFQVQENSDTSRLDRSLPAGSIAKLLVADPAIKKVDQPYETFGGRLPELDGNYYLRVSELLRHKGRAIQKWDYERLVLEKFPQIYKAKCINHSFHTNAHVYDNDVPYAPGYVLLALLPDLTKMKAGNSYEPKVPVSLLEMTEQYLKKITSPFVRIKAANPRYEKVNFCLTVRLLQGKDKTYYKEQLKIDLRTFLAPWAIGKYDKLSFGQCVYRSDVLRFLELTGYIDFIADFRMTHEKEPFALNDQALVCPLSPRSILVAGSIDVIIDDPVCEDWCNRARGIKRCEGPELVHNYCK